MMKKCIVLLAGVFFVAALVSCGSSVKTNPAVKFPLAVSDAQPAFLFPINMSHLGSKANPTQMGLSVSAGIIAKYGKKVISGQQLFDLVGNLSWELAETIQSQARPGKWKMEGSAERVASGLSSLMSSIIDKLVALKLISSGVKFKYIIAVHSHGKASMAPGMLSVETWGGVYDVDTKQILSYLENTSTYKDDEKILLAQLPVAYNNIIEDILTAGKK
jgi:hypothetical protein